MRATPLLSEFFSVYLFYYVGEKNFVEFCIKIQMIIHILTKVLT